jgi:DNA-3-methyladenine glycosylase
VTQERLARSFYARSAHEVAPDLLGHILVRSFADGSRASVRIVEVEAYGPDDPASHAFRGETPRNAVMFGPPGHLYVYFTYGMHHCMNVVTGGTAVGSAVLLRAAEPLEGIDEMLLRRGRERLLDLCSGPGRLAQALGVDRRDDGVDLVAGGDLWLEAGSRTEPVAAGNRVGVHETERLWRYWLEGDPFVSRGRPGPPTARRRTPPARSMTP